MSNVRLDRLGYGLALLLAVVPLWVAQHLPLVDLPQHLHLISVLHRLDDPTTLYPQVFTLRGNLTPYLGYYYAVSALHWLLPLERANALFLSAYVAGMALAMGFLLRSLGRSRWPSVLALPFAYGDSFGWGFLNYCTALPLTFLCCGLFVRALADAPRRRAWAGGAAVALVAVLLFHVQAFAFLAVALPLLLLTTRAPEDRDATRPWPGRLMELLRPRVPALLSVVPGVALFFIWVVGRVGEPTEIQPGVPWKAWGPVLSPQNLGFKPFSQNLDELVPLLGNLFRDGSDRYAVYGAFAVAGLGVVLAAVGWVLGRGKVAVSAPREGPVERFRLLALGLLALGLFFALPFDIRGYSYYLNSRYAHLAAPLVLAAVPGVLARFRTALVLLGAAVAAVLCYHLELGFRAFDQEAIALEQVASAAAPKARVMGLMFDSGSRVVGHPVFLHGAATVAREAGGYCNFSFALTPHSPLRYRDAPPPTFPSEWHPEQFNWQTMGPAYDHFLVRGVSPVRLFGQQLQQGELGVAARAGDFWLLRRRSGP